jgi:hypothetical protein
LAEKEPFAVVGGAGSVFEVNRVWQNDGERIKGPCIAGGQATLVSTFGKNRRGGLRGTADDQQRKRESAAPCGGR